MLVFVSGYYDVHTYHSIILGIAGTGRRRGGGDCYLPGAAFAAAARCILYNTYGSTVVAQIALVAPQDLGDGMGREARLQPWKCPASLGCAWPGFITRVNVRCISLDNIHY